jgi:hypothetical protein
LKLINQRDEVRGYERRTTDKSTVHVGLGK